MAENNGNSNFITRQYMDSLLVETRYMNAENPDLTMRLFGRTFASPVMTAALSHLDHFMFEGASRALADGAAKAGAVFWIGMADEAEIEQVSESGASVVEIIKPYTDRDIIFQKIRHAEKCGALAVGIDIDHPFGPDGSPDVVDGYEMTAVRTEELAEIVRSTSLPVIAKGVLSLYDAEEVLKSGAAGMLVSHHNGRIDYACPALAVLPEIRKLAGKDYPIFMDGDIRTGMDAFKALALGATAVGIGRPLMTALKEGGAEAVAEYLGKVNAGLAKAMACTGCPTLDRLDPSVIHRVF